MIFRARFVLAALGILALRGQCFADLFAIGTSAAEIYRIDSDTGQVVDTYPLPGGQPASFMRSGLAFDGRVLYLSVGNSQIDSLAILRYDVVADEWLAATPLALPVSPEWESIGGRGFATFPDRKTLVAVQSNPYSPASGPVVLTEIPVTAHVPDGQLQMFNGVYNPFPPPIVLPDDSGVGLDVDPLTGEIWAATTDLTTAADTLSQVDPQGFVTQTFALTSLQSRVGGIGFDAGRMFVVDVARNIYELDRADASVINMFTLPGPGLIGGLTGGEVVPEPSTFALLASVVGGMVARHRRLKKLKCGERVTPRFPTQQLVYSPNLMPCASGSWSE